MNNEGYIQLPRIIKDEELYFRERFTAALAYIDLFFLAAWTKRSFIIRGNEVTIERGQIAISEQNLANRWRWSRNTVRKFLTELQKEGKIEQQKSRIINVITLKYYCYSEQQNEQQSEQQNEQPNINNIEINIKDKKLSQKEISLDFVPDYVDFDFRDLYIEWMRYRKQIGKPYKSDIGRKRFYNQLIGLSGGDTNKARLIIEQSEANEWQGIFNLKQDNNYGNSNSRSNNRPTPNDNIADAQEAALNRMRAVISSAD